MKLPRGQFLRLATGTAALSAVSRIAWAQTYPTRPVRIVVGFPPGGGADITARLIGQWLSERLGQPFIIENRPGAGSNIATEAVVRAPPDGYTLLLVGAFNAVNATLYDKLNFNFIRDIAPVATMYYAPNVMAVHPSFPAKTIPEFIAYSKSNPGKVNMGSGTTGATMHMSGELFKIMAGIDMVPVPYRGGGPAVQDMAAGQLDLMFDQAANALGPVRAGTVKAYAVMSKARWSALPNVPSADESGTPGLYVAYWHAMWAPKGTPKDVIASLHTALVETLADPSVRQRLTDLGQGLWPRDKQTPEALAAQQKAEIEKWWPIIKAANIKAE